MIQINDIEKGFNGVEILKGISFEFQTGKTNLIIGQSGSGKSVLTKCIVALHQVDKGEVLYDGRDIQAMSNKERKELRQEIGMLFQGSALFDSMTVEENVMFPLKMFTKMSKAEMQERVNFCLNRVELFDKNGLYPAETSGGMQKRIAIARAIAMNPKYLFCDEPNSGLDPKTAIVIDNLIKDITEEFNMTTVVITHDMNSVLEIGENIMFLSQGLKAWEGTKESIITTDAKEVTEFVYASKFMRDYKDRMM